MMVVCAEMAGNGSRNATDPSWPLDIDSGRCQGTRYRNIGLGFGAGCVEVGFLYQLQHHAPLAYIIARRRSCGRSGPICPGVHHKSWQKQQRVGSGGRYPSLFVERCDVLAGR